MRHVRDDARQLPEPDWYAGLSILGRCADGEALAHAWSRAYPHYSAAETTEKLGHALEHGPRTCAAIHQQLGFAACRRCPHFQQITSPIVLGTPHRPLGGAEAAALGAPPAPPDRRPLQ